MKKTIVLSAMALCFSATAIHAETNLETAQNSIAIVETSPFHMSIVKGDTETVQKLIDLGADVNKKWNGLTPAMYAAKFNRAEILEVLIANGANLKSKCDKGHTAAEYAEMSNAADAQSVIKAELKKKK
ncbi:ankyrin repeat domain-containing protein [Hanstruepera ponticola]|uniref:ankyrin repeat domain-containing protein n=1 Tax=Hanstruepera ponticola TaxID=2042995 RepID=UPI000CF164AE|nr:ankyrin repeat domain-containing protein [Hanstruepera ponticola]